MTFSTFGKDVAYRTNPRMVKEIRDVISDSRATYARPLINITSNVPYFLYIYTYEYSHYYYY